MDSKSLYFLKLFVETFLSYSVGKFKSFVGSSFFESVAMLHVGSGIYRWFSTKRREICLLYSCIYLQSFLENLKKAFYVEGFEKGFSGLLGVIARVMFQAKRVFPVLKFKETQRERF